MQINLTIRKKYYKKNGMRLKTEYVEESFEHGYVDEAGARRIRRRDT